MKLTADTTNLNVPNGTKIFADGMPRLTIGGFVGSANIDPQYALKVKNEDVYVDIRDFLQPRSTSRDARRRIAENATRMLRRQCVARALAKSANVPTGETVLTTPNATLSAQVTDVKRHLIGTTKEDFSDVEQKILSGCTVQVLDAAREGGNTIYSTHEVDSLKCFLQGYTASPEKNWIEQNDVQLVVPIEVALEALPEERRLEYEKYQSQFPNGGLVAPITGSGMLAPFDRGFTACAPPATLNGDWMQKFFNIANYATCVVDMIWGGDTAPYERKFYVVDDLSDLMREIQNPRVTGPNGLWDSLKKVIMPITTTVINTVDAFMDVDRVTRNGYALQDMENVVFCKNFTEVCHECGFEDITTMLESVARGKSGSNFLDFLFEAIPVICNVVGEVFFAQNTGPKLLGEGEIDYSAGGYPFAPGEIDVLSMSTSGIGASGALGVLNPFPPNYGEGSDPEEEQAPMVESVGTFSVGNSIPRSMVWKLDPIFEESGGTMENVGVYLKYSAFDFSRIQVFLQDSIGFTSPCNTDVISVHNFDSTTTGSGVAVLEIATQGSTAITTPFPYTIVETPARACLSRCVPTDILVGSQIDKNWLVVMVSDKDIGESAEYKNICTLTPEGFEIDPVDTSQAGWKDIIIRPNHAETDIATSVRVNVVVPSIEEVSDYRDHYDMQAYIDPASPLTPGKTVTPDEIVVKGKSVLTGLPFFYGTAGDLIDNGFISSIMLNGGDVLELVEGNNTFVFMSNFVGNMESVTGQFVVKVVREVSEIAFTPRDGSRVRICHPASVVVSGNGISTEIYDCSLMYADGSIYSVPDDGYTLEVVYPPVYTDGSVIGEVRVRPYAIDAYDSQVLSTRIPYSVVYVTEDPRVVSLGGSIQSVEYKSNRLPWVGEYPDPEDFVVTAVWGATAEEQDGTLHTLNPTSYTVRAYSSITGTETDMYMADSTGVRVHWGDLHYDANVAIANHDGSPITLGSIEIVARKGKSTTVPYGTPLSVDHFDVTGVSADGEYRKTIEDHLHITGYYPMYAGKLDVTLQYGTGDTAKTATVAMRVQEPDIVKVVVTPKSPVFEVGDKLSVSDVTVTAVTSSGVDIEVPSSQVRVTAFETGFIGDQTFMGTVETVGVEGGANTGSVTTASFRYDVGLGGDDTRFTTPALVCKFSKPYCFVGESVESLTDLGFEGAYVIASDGSRIAVDDTENVHLGQVDTSKVGMVYVGVEYTPESQ